MTTQAFLCRPALRAAFLLAACLVSFPLAGAEIATDPAGRIKISSNENVWGYSPRAQARLQAELARGNYYNHDEIAEFVKLAAAYNGVKEDMILPTAGSGPLLLLAALAYAEPGKNVVTTAMGYTQLIQRFAARGGDVKFAPLSAEMGYDFDALARTIDERTVMVYICNPNNPTGVLADPRRLRQFVMSVRKDVLVFVDEAYLELADTGLKANTMAPLTRLRENLLVTRTFSKGYGMAGLRFGYGIAHPSVLERLEAYATGGPSYLAAIAAQEALRDEAFLEQNRQQYIAVRDYVCAEFDRLGIAYARQPQGAFVYFRAGLPSEVLNARLRAANIYIGSSRESGVPEGTYGDWSRVSVGTREQMDAFLVELTRILGKT